MADVLTITVLVPDGTYPSVNHTGVGVFRNGRKSPEYHALFEAVKNAAEEEMRRVGWETATDLCWASIVRYKPTRHRHDVGNIGKAEADALTEAGVWVDDDRAKPILLDSEYDPAGPDRIVIIVRRRFASASLPVTPSRAPRTRAAVSSTPAPKEKSARPVYRGGPIPDGYAVCGNELIPIDEARALISGGARRD